MFIMSNVVHPKMQAKLARDARSTFDVGMYLVALVTPLLTVPQLVIIWSSHQTQGISVITWGAYAAASGLWLIYALLRKQKQLIVTQLLLFILDFAVVLGVYIYRS